ncbi:WXG100 family type VII secretion target [Lachnospiraceae bacterium XBB2008]|nr:WXG100 family type VII secretion target [Lachnospiraceae bacterium XBB2008]
MDGNDGVIIKVDPQRMEQQANDINDDVENMKSNALAMISEINSMKSYWKGEASDLQQQQFASLIDELQQMYMLLQKYPKDLLTLVEGFTQNEIRNDEEANSLRKPSYNMG